MNKNKKWFYRTWISGVLLAASCHGLAQQTQAASGDVFTELSDRLHQIDGALPNPTAMSRYSFTSVRGQDVLLATPGFSVGNSLWKVEYQVDGGQWETKAFNSPVAIKNLKPGSTVKVRVMALEEAQFQQAAYQVVLGSYPHMRYELHHEEGFLKIPHGLTDPPFLATQAYTKALLEAWFTDSKAFPLEGGVMRFELEPHQGEKEITKTWISDSAGKISELIEFNRCDGGKYAKNFVHKNHVKGKNTWATLYRVGHYRAFNVLLEDRAEQPYKYDFGHVCKRMLVNWSRS
ncbi:hypothetical protein [Pseudomonas sp. NPDC089734]|uniref:hypothetical protein n=1 Tax=Pseudomonas sp. NPDC089734 TaxID=3364469 RepID=UPI0037F92E6E